MQKHIRQQGRNDCPLWRTSFCRKPLPLFHNTSSEPFAIPAGLLGAASWTALYQTSAGQWLVNQANVGSVIITGQTIAGTSPVTLFLIALPYAVVLLAIAYFLPRFKNTNHSCLRALIRGEDGPAEKTPAIQAIREDTTAYLLEGSIAKKGSKAEHFARAMSSEPNVYSRVMLLIAILVGIAVVMGIMLHQIFGESTTYSWVIAVLIMPTYKYSVGVLAHIGWEPFSDIGTFLGAFFSSVVITKRFTAFRKVVPPSWRNRFGNTEWKRAVGVFFGSYLMLFGARMADGCASGHILSGVVQMAASGLFLGIPGEAPLEIDEYGNAWMGNECITEPPMLPMAWPQFRKNMYDLMQQIGLEPEILNKYERLYVDAEALESHLGSRRFPRGDFAR